MPRSRLLLLPAVLAMSATVLIIAVTSRQTDAGGSFATQDLTTALEPVDLANTLLGGGITVSNVTYTGADVAAGTFSGGSSIGGAGIGFDSGVILSSGNISLITGPNTSESITGINGTAGDTSLDALITPRVTEDASVLTFSFVPQSTQVQFQYVFASDEYNEFVNTQFDDVFAFFVNGVNCATVPSTSGPTRVSINTVNNGNPLGTTPNSNPSLYINNDFQDPDPAPYNTEMDGFTVVLTCTAAVNAGVTNTMKLAIADAEDSQYDSVVFLKAGSFTIPTPTATHTFTPTNTATLTPIPTITLTPTFSPTSTFTHTPPPDATITGTATPTSTSTPTPTNTTPPEATATNTATPTVTNTPPPDATVTHTATPTSTHSPTGTPTSQATFTPTACPTHQAPVAGGCGTFTPTPTNTLAPEETATHTPTSTNTPTATVTTPSGGECDRADLNGDGKVTTADVVHMATGLAKNKKSQDVEHDVNGDGNVDAKDLITVVKCRNAEKKGFAIF